MKGSAHILPSRGRQSISQVLVDSTHLKNVFCIYTKLILCLSYVLYIFCQVGKQVLPVICVMVSFKKNVCIIRGCLMMFGVASL